MSYTTDPTRSVDENASSPPVKRQRFNPESTDVFAAGLLDQSTDLHIKYMASLPYLHTTIAQLVNPTLLRAVCDEIHASLHFTEKETDIYKVFQTGDLANIDGLDPNEKLQLANVHRLRNALYSQMFRDFVSRVTHCGPLSGTKMDMSINSYRQGCHLLNHDDVIGTRCVSFILYLADDWDPTFGGALELYPCVSHGTPDSEPTVTIPPAFNQFVMFAVQPGYSFHSVQEVVANRDRLSISGWFHIPQPGETGYSADGPQWAIESSTASLDQLQGIDHANVFKDHSPIHLPTVCETNLDQHALSEDDCTILKQYINPKYLSPTILEEINAVFSKKSNIQLATFLNEEMVALLNAQFHVLDEEDGYKDGTCQLLHGKGVRRGWKVQGPPITQRYMQLDPESDKSALTARLGGLVELFRSVPFAKWVYQVTGVEARSVRVNARRFRPGLDYTLATSSPCAAVDVTLAMTPSNGRWGDGSVGGYQCYVSPDEENGDPSVYRGSSSASGTLLTVPNGWNVVNLVLRDPGVMHFVKYVSALAPSSRFDVSGEYVFEDCGRE